MTAPVGRGQPGLGIDSFGGQVIDPTANVLALVEAAVARQDDLRKADAMLQNARIQGLADLVKQQATHQKKSNKQESQRLNAIRQVDVLAVNTSAAQSLQAIQALAATTTTNAENLRNALTATASTIATQTAATVSAITDRLAALEKSSYEGKGKEAVSDPQLLELVASVKALSSARSEGTGSKDLSRYVTNLLGLIVGLAIAVVALLVKR